VVAKVENIEGDIRLAPFIDREMCNKGVRDCSRFLSVVSLNRERVRDPYRLNI